MKFIIKQEFQGTMRPRFPRSCGGDFRPLTFLRGHSQILTCLYPDKLFQGMNMSGYEHVGVRKWLEYVHTSAPQTENNHKRLAENFSLFINASKRL